MQATYSGVAMVYVWRTDRVLKVYGYCTYLVRMAYVWCTSSAALEEIRCSASGTKAPSGPVFPDVAELQRLGSSRYILFAGMRNRLGH
jgi:hypothetical protein